jgi:hypothetical protein
MRLRLLSLGRHSRPNIREKTKQKEIMEGIQQLPPHQQQQFMRELEMMQLKDSLWYAVRIFW